MRAALVLGFAALVACSRDAPTRAAPVVERVHWFEGSDGSHGRVTQRFDADGSETLASEMHITPREAPARHVREAAAIDANGKLLRAEVTIDVDGGAAEGLTLEASTGMLEVRRASTVRRWRLPTDAGWMYAPSDDGALVATPVAAWIAFRASKGAGVVRVIKPDGPDALVSYLAPVDQIAVPTESATTVVLNHDGIDVRGFVESVRLSDLQVSLSSRETAPAAPGS